MRLLLRKGVLTVEDWRLQDQEEYLSNAVLYQVTFPAFWEKAYAEKNSFYENIWEYALRHVKAYPQTKEYLEGDKVQRFWHEHCEFCWEKAMTDIECTFYCTKDMRCWICETCFHDFQGKFHWTVKPAEEIFL